MGRTDDMVCIRGVNVYPSSVEEILRAHGGVAEYQVLVQRTDSLAEISIQAEPLPSVANAAAFAEELERALQTAFNLRIPVTAVAPGSLPRFEMKAKRWVQM